MSYSTMLIVPEIGPLEAIAEFGNAWGFGPRIWNAIAESFMPSGWNWIMTAGSYKSRVFWNLVSDPLLAKCERLTHAITYDRVICERDKATQMAEMLREFDARHPAPCQHVNHLIGIADALEKNAEKPCVGFAWIVTSVTDDVWDVKDVCLEAFHDRERTGYCEMCGNQWSDRQCFRTFDWSKDREKNLHFMLFERYGERRTE